MYELEIILLNCGPLNFTVNIFGYHKGKTYPIHIGTVIRALVQGKRKRPLMSFIEISKSTEFHRSHYKIP